MSDCAAVEGYLGALEAKYESARRSLMATFRSMPRAQVAECLKVVASKDASLAITIAADPDVDVSAISREKTHERDERLYGGYDPIAGF